MYIITRIHHTNIKHLHLCTLLYMSCCLQTLQTLLNELNIALAFAMQRKCVISTACCSQNLADDSVQYCFRLQILDCRDLDRVVGREP